MSEEDEVVENSLGSSSDSEIDKNAQIYKEMRDQDELDDDKEIDAALSTIKKKEHKIDLKP